MSRSSCLIAVLSALGVLGWILFAFGSRDRPIPTPPDARSDDLDARLSAVEERVTSIEAAIEQGLSRADPTAVQEPIREVISQLETRLDKLEKEDRDSGEESGEDSGEEPAEDFLARADVCLSSASGKLRKEGIEILREHVDSHPEALQMIRSMLDDPDDEVRGEALDALADLRDGDLVSRLVDFTTDASPRVREQAVQAIEDFYEEAGIAGADALAAARSVVTCLSDPDADVREVAADTLGDLKFGEGVPGLIQCLEDPEGNIRDEAIVSLSEIGDPAAILPLRRVYEQESGEKAMEIAVALRRLGDEQTFQEEVLRLSQVARTAGDDAVRTDAIGILAQYASGESKKVFEDALKNGSPKVREAAEEALRGRRANHALSHSSVLRSTRSR